MPTMMEAMLCVPDFCDTDDRSRRMPAFVPVLVYGKRLDQLERIQGGIVWIDANESLEQDRDFHVNRKNETLRARRQSAHDCGWSARPGRRRSG
ncbi:hypothetical protein [Noviherbaspirillum galbum]|uniref:Uncharacterized protein n=1 Tax=Noviherbaspirillum galbum TaxID=2709383 RepID=A0A6B3SGC2_9BURK|nr:hypothetical protein [Noviherbaspirillum galbum]NEX59653.1 hypothetical protein [Noviherbaspirillum galbum]